LSSQDKASEPIHVVAAAVTDAEGRVLIAQRPPGKRLAGSWEFPGGKVEPGETRVLALARELREELGIGIVGPPRPLIRVRHAYPFGEVLIDMWVVTRYEGEPQGLDGQRLRWCARDDLATADLLPADRPILRALRLPERLTQVASPDYTVVEFGERCSAETESGGGHRILRGILCSGVTEGVAVSLRGCADFLVMRRMASESELVTLCSSVLLPVFARVDSMEHAWVLGVSGLNEI
jgi:mutator protein MutT